MGRGTRETARGSSSRQGDNDSRRGSAREVGTTPPVKAVRYHEAAESELLTTVGYLELRPGIRKRLLRKFRYSLIYFVEGDELVIPAVAHASRRPGY